MPEGAVAAVRGFQIFDSRGWPTLAVEVELDSGETAWAEVPSGTSIGSREARELRDGGRPFSGRGVMLAVQKISKVVNPFLVGRLATQQSEIDSQLMALDGREDQSVLGANTMLGVSMAVSKAAAQWLKIPLYRYLGQEHGVLPTPQFNVINGGLHADSEIPVQEFLIIPGGAASFTDAMRMGVEVYHALKRRLSRVGYRTAVGDEGGFAPRMTGIHQVFDVLLESIVDAGLRPDQDVALGIDVAASALRREHRYRWGESVLAADETTYRWRESTLEADQLIDQYIDWIRQYPLISIEDGLAEDDWSGWSMMTSLLGGRCQIIGDDIFVTHRELLSRGVREQSANALIVKPNQIGTVTLARDVAKFAASSGWNVVASSRSGETCDTFLADFAVAVGAPEMKAGAPAQGERLAKYNRLLSLEAHDPSLNFAGWSWRKFPESRGSG